MVIFTKPSQNTKDKSLTLISTYFPDIKDDIQQYAKQQNVDEGDIAYLVVVDIIYPFLQKMNYD